MKIDRLLRKADLAFYNYENDGQIDTQALVFILLLLGKRFRFAPAPMILTGVALSALIETFVQFSLMKGTEEVYDILRWLAGSTYRVTPDQAILLMICASVFILITLSLHRWLTLMSIGKMAAPARGIAVKPTFVLLLMLAAALCATVTDIKLRASITDALNRRVRCWGGSLGLCNTILSRIFQSKPSIVDYLFFLAQRFDELSRRPLV